MSAGVAPAKKGKPRGKPFEKGTSGNPGGRPKAQRELQEALIAQFGSNVPALMQRLMLLGHGGNVFAIKEFLDRVLGKATQKAELSGPQGGAIPVVSSSPTTGEVRERLRELIDIAQDQAATKVRGKGR